MKNVETIEGVHTHTCNLIKKEKNLRIRKIAIMTIVSLLLQVILPTLTMLNGDLFNVGVMASTTNEYNISTAQELWDFATEVNGGNTFSGKTVKLTADITLDCNSDKQWIPICSFSGTFDGQSHSISGIYINTDEDEQGLFGYNTGTIKNLIIKECNISSSGSFTGAVTGRNSGSIIDVINESTITGGNYLGGIVGLNDEGIIIDCSNNGDIIGKRHIGGIAGKQDYRAKEEGYTLIMNCSNSGNIKSTLTIGNSYAGGIVGDSACATAQGRVVVNRCNNTGLIEGAVYAGGICGSQGDGNGGDTSYIKKCWNSGTVKSYVYGGETTAITYSYTGGIVGDNNCGYIDECYNSGEILGAIDAGGLTCSNSGIVINSYNLGSVNASIDIENSSDYQLSKLSGSSVGGIVGFNFDTIKNCYNSGKVVADNASGLVCSNKSDAIVENCYNVGNIEAIKSSSIIDSNSRNNK